MVQTESSPSKVLFFWSEKQERELPRVRKSGEIPFLKSSFHSFPVHTPGKPTVPRTVTAVAAGQAYKILRKRTLITGAVVPRAQDES